MTQTSIRISSEAKEKLGKLRRTDESYEETILRLYKEEKAYQNYADETDCMPVKDMQWRE